MKRCSLILVGILVIFSSCHNKRYYSLEDFNKVEKIDAHYHVYTSSENSIEPALNDNFRLLAINTYSGGCERVVEAHHWLTNLHRKHSGNFAYTATFCLDGWDDPAWAENTIAWIDECIYDGANSVKVWKNVGMEFRDQDSNLIMIDDPRFDPVFAYLAERKIPLVGHLGEPRNCWLPLEKMTTRNDSSYFADNPQYHMFLHADYPSYEEQMQARDRMLEKNPDLVFIGCHLASLEWSVDELAVFLNRFPNAAVDMAARMGQLFYQTREDHTKVRDFFIRYQDRILYGTDIIDRGRDPEGFANNLHQTWLTDWEYLATDNTMTSNLIDGEFRGLKLPREVIDKIYHHNALKWYRWE